MRWSGQEYARVGHNLGTDLYAPPNSFQLPRCLTPLPSRSARLHSARFVEIDFTRVAAASRQTPLSLSGSLLPATPNREGRGERP